jgi:RHS repeat-associated protein
LYGPYGTGRYSSGTMPGSYGFTGQRADSATGLDYYVARYYDPMAGQFISADPAGDGLNRYAYVKGNPETLTDPTGLWTFGICIGGSAGAGIGGFVQGCVVVGNSGGGQWSSGVTGTIGGGGYAGVGAGITVEGQFSNANSVDDLKGPFGYLGAGVVLPTGGGFVGTDSRNRGVGGVQGGLSFGPGGGIFGGLSFTAVKHVDWLALAKLYVSKVYAGDAANMPIAVPMTRAAVELYQRTSQSLDHARLVIANEAHDVSSWAQQQTNRAGSWVNQQVRQVQNWLGQWFR